MPTKLDYCCKKIDDGARHIYGSVRGYISDHFVKCQTVLNTKHNETKVVQTFACARNTSMSHIRYLNSHMKYLKSTKKDDLGCL